jgi:uracil-DNA glycosylase family 4
MKILFVGSNPSSAAKTQNPFCTSTKSGKLLNDWLIASGQYPLSLTSTCYANVADYPTENNRPLLTAEIKSNLSLLQRKVDIIKPDKIIALGKTAEKALTLLRTDYYPMPHPSGLNRLLNDPEYVKKKINGLRDYLNPSVEI